MTEQEAKEMVGRLKPFFFHDGWHPPDEEEITPQVAEEWAVRLLRIWVSKECRDKDITCRHSRNNFFFEVRFEVGVYLSFTHTIGAAPMAYMAIQRSKRTESGVFLHYLDRRKRGPKIGFLANRTPEINAFLKPFADKWFPYFHHGCWLSGLPVEVGAHEKAEWIQGFSKEELEAWDLKM